MDETTITVVSNLIGSLGFPIFCAIYFMTFLNKNLQKNNELLQALISEVRKNG